VWLIQVNGFWQFGHCVDLSSNSIQLLRPDKPHERIKFQRNNLAVNLPFKPAVATVTAVQWESVLTEQHQSAIWTIQSEPLMLP
jgi:hypothetical protein